MPAKALRLAIGVFNLQLMCCSALCKSVPFCTAFAASSWTLVTLLYFTLILGWMILWFMFGIIFSCFDLLPTFRVNIICLLKKVHCEAQFLKTAAVSNITSPALPCFLLWLSRGGYNPIGAAVK